MSNLRVPSLQHLARNWRSNPAFIASALVRLAENPPQFNYNPLFGAVRDLLVFNVPYEQIEAGIRRIPSENVRDNLLSILPLLRDHFSGLQPDYCQTVGRRFYPIGRGLMVPFEAPLLFGVGGQLHFPWFVFWRQNPITNERLSLFATLVDEMLMQDPDLEQARFHILDFSAPDSKNSRELTIIEASDIPRVNHARKVEMLDGFAEGYFRAVEILARRTETEPSDRPEARPDPDQPNFPGFPD